MRVTDLSTGQPSGRSDARYCDVVIPRTRLDELTYDFDPATGLRPQPGDCVEVPLRGRAVAGIVTGWRARSPVSTVHHLRRVVRPGLLNGEALRLARWIAGYYFARLGEVMGHFVPRRVEKHELLAPAEVEAAREAEAVLPAALAPFAAAAAESRFGVFVSCRERERLSAVVAATGAARGRGSVILLLPESKLVHWTAGLRERFGPGLLEYRAGMSERDLRETWLRIRATEQAVVVGVRAAVLAPVPDLAALILVDEQDGGFKEERRPRYHSRDVAIARARLRGCPLLLVSRVPSLETWYNVGAGRFHLVEPPQEGQAYAQGFVVDMKLHRGTLFSPRLLTELRQVVEQRRSAVVYINRRGLSRHAVCVSCGEVIRCGQCGAAVTVTEGEVLCRVCGARRAAPDSCPACRGTEFDFRAPGVEMVVRELRRTVADAEVMPVVAETAEPAPAGKVILVGTRALLGREWPADTALVAAVSADAGLAAPDFRSRERTFQALHELGRRAARVGARLVVQTRRPDDPVVRSAVEGGVAGILDSELRFRRELGFPPFSRLALITLSGRPADVLVRQAAQLQRTVGGTGRAEALGPLVEGERRPAVKLLAKLPRAAKLADFLSPDRLDSLKVDWRVDVDPLELF